LATDWHALEAEEAAGQLGANRRSGLSSGEAARRLLQFGPNRLPPPRDPREPLLSWFFAWRVMMVSFLMMLGTLGLFLRELHDGTGLDTARTMAVSAVVVAQMFYLLNSRSILGSVLSWKGLTGNRHVPLAILVCAVLQFAYVYATPLQSIFASTPLTGDQWGKVVAAGMLVFGAAELEKLVMRQFRTAASDWA